jgi:hypothetical protein
MSHVDEGTLHAWLDGALDALPEAEAERVREHLASCAACAARLEEERRIRQEAADILGAAAPLAVEPPAFEELRAMARARSRASTASGRVARLGWAASVVLALGTGWMLRDASVPDFAREGFVRGEAPSSPEGAGRDRDAADAADVAEAPVAPPTLLAPAEERAGGRADAATEGGRAKAPAQEGALEMERVVGARSAGADPASEADAAAARRGEAEAAAFQPVDAMEAGGIPARLPVLPPAERFSPEPVRLDDALIEGVVFPTRLDTLTFPRTAAEAKEAVAAASLEAIAAPLGGVRPEHPTLASATRITEDAAKARPPFAPGDPAVRRAAAPMNDEAMRSVPVVPGAARTLGSGVSGSLVVPGLEVLSVSGLDGEGLPGAVRVRQRLAGGDTLEMVHLPAGAEPSALEPVPDDGRTELVLPRQGGWLVVRAHADREALLELVRRIDRGG